ncbi:hypothetical protein PM082_015489 [Marasmius tenuissimus]|nr:hypothetical protein PM082_015489 [Marasmius tenuissimus]
MAMEGGSDLGITIILRIISSRRLKLLSNTPDNIMAQELVSTKQTLREYLVLEHDGFPKNWTNFSTLDKEDNDLGWLAAALDYIPHKLANQPLSPAQIALQHHFCLWVLRYRFCSRGEPIPDNQGSQPWGHYSIQSISRKYPIPNLYIRDHQRYRGDFQRYLSARIEVGGVGKPIACWRSVDGNGLCTGRDGDSLLFEPVVSLPQILITRVDTNDATPLNSECTKWNFPHLVYPYGTNASARKAGVVYKLVARTFYNGGHYIARFTAVTSTATRRRAVFSYDGMRNNGFSTREAKGGVAKLLGGSAVENLPPGYYTSAVFYVLQGGRSAQDWVWNRQTEALRSMVGIDLSNSAEKARTTEPTFQKQGYSEVPLNNQFWLSAEQKAGREIHNRKREYEAPPIKSSASKFGATELVSEVTQIQTIHKHDQSDHQVVEHCKPEPPATQTMPSDDGNESLISMDRPPSSSSRGSVVPFQCRCGETEDGDRQTIKQKIIQCEAPGCETWHHVACQLGGEREISNTFYCHMCNGDLPGFMGNRWKRKFLDRLKESIEKGEIYLIKDIKSRLQWGIMILVLDGLFYYPARLIEPVSGTYWRVKFWRGNVTGLGAIHEPGDYTEVHIQKIVDGLSNNIEGRRAIRIGRFMTTQESNELENKQEYPTPMESRRYTTEINNILSPHTEALRKLIFNPEDCDPSDYPSLQYQKEHKTRIVPLTGGLPPTTRSRVMNWMYNFIPGLKVREDHTWVTDGGLQEALMRLIAHRDEGEFSALESCPKKRQKRDEFIRARAWDRLDQYTVSTI